MRACRVQHHSRLGFIWSLSTSLLSQTGPIRGLYSKQRAPTLFFMASATHSSRSSGVSRTSPTPASKDSGTSTCTNGTTNFVYRFSAYAAATSTL
uniref:Uncharacterized protein n=1 Tax=Panstrongylus lignarius TaxID=156445 RepID=A0A224Y3K4_9HEMI